MNKNDLVNQVSDNTGLSKSDSAKAVDSVLDTITDTLKSGGDVRLVGFGTFLVSKRKNRREIPRKKRPHILMLWSIIGLRNMR